MIGRTILFSAFLLATSLQAQQQTSDETAREYARRLLMSAYAEAGHFCDEFSRGTYVTHIGGVRIDVDCKIRNDFVASLSPAERKKLRL